MGFSIKRTDIWLLTLNKVQIMLDDWQNSLKRHHKSAMVYIICHKAIAYNLHLTLLRSRSTIDIRFLSTRISNINKQLHISPNAFRQS